LRRVCISIRQFSTVVAFAAAFASPAAAADRDLTGDWTGGYVSAGGSDANTFNVKLKSSGAMFTGTATELNAFGDAN
jgi:hypothetical protein